MRIATCSSNLLHSSEAFEKACFAAGLRPQAQLSVSAGVVLFEASEGVANSLNAQTSAALIENLRAGGRLLFTLAPYAGQSAFRLSSALPSTGWTSTMRPSSFQPSRPIPIQAVGDDFFPSGSLAGLEVPAGADIRPVSAAERGQARYERYRIHHPVLGTDVPAHSDLWSRPLLNREWTVRAVYNDLARMPLLVTGRYGGGRVAMLATTVAAVGESSSAQSFWRAVLHWLMTPDLSPVGAPRRATLAMSFPSPSTVRLTCSAESSGPVQLVMRVLDRDGAMLADGMGEHNQAIDLKARQATVIDLSLNPTAMPGREQRQSELSFQVRAGLLSAEGSTLLVERRDSSSVPLVTLRVMTEPLPLHAIFAGPGPDAIAGFQGRMGLPVNVYAVKPAMVLHGTAVLSLQCRNLASAGTWHDRTTPGNASVVALNDGGAAVRRGPSDGIGGWGMWTGVQGVENVLETTLASPARLSSVTLVGSHGPYVYGEEHNPRRVTIEVDHRPVTFVDDLDPAFAAGMGQANIILPPASLGTVITVRLPWVAKQGSGVRREPWLGEIMVEGWPESDVPAAPVHGRLKVNLADAVGTVRATILESSQIVRAGQILQLPFRIQVPAGEQPGVYRLEASFTFADRISLRATAPILAVPDGPTLLPLQDLAGPQVFGTGLNVTNGFTKFDILGTGTTESWNGWGHPDDLVWAYSRQLKEIRPRARGQVNRLYASLSDMRHYSIPWREFGNGQLFFPAMIGGLVSNLKAQRGWASARLVRLTFGDRWVVGPDLQSCNSWQEYVAFDGFLRTTNGSGLEGRTHADIEHAIHTQHESEWQEWQLDRYLRSVRSVREAFQAEGKDVFIYSQNIPVVAGPAGRELAQTMRGMNDDFTWGMQDNNPTLTTGRHLGELAFNPVWKVATLLPWGFASPVFNNWQWHSPVAAIEPIRRLLYNRLWRGMLWDGGRYSNLATYGYADNVGTSFAPTSEEYQEWWNIQQRGNLLQPESPLGAGLVISTQKNATAGSIRWNGLDGTALPEPRMLMDAFRSLSEAGVSLPFAANASTLAEWDPPPGIALIALNLPDWSEAEIAGLARMQSRGVKIAVFAEKASLSSSAVQLVERTGTLLIPPLPARMTHPEALNIGRQLMDALRLPLQFSDGLNGYGFRSGSLNYLVVEDWREQARMGSVRVRKSSGAQHAFAANLNDHSSLAVKAAGDFWEVSVPIRSGDAALLALKES